MVEYTMNEIDLEKWNALFFAVRRSIRYHNYRRRFFESWAVWSNFLVIISGGTVVGFSTYAIETSQPYYHWGSVLFGGIIGIIGTFDLVVGFSNRARDHHDLVREFSQLERDLTKVGDKPTEKDLVTYTNRRLEIEANEPPVLRALDTYCHNELVRAMEKPEGEKAKIAWYQNLFKQWCDIFPERIKKFKDLESQGNANLTKA